MGDTLGIVLHLHKAYARGAMTDIDKFTMYPCRDEIWARYLECSRACVVRRQGTKCLLKSNKRALKDSKPCRTDF